jgi:sortase A
VRRFGTVLIVAATLVLGWMVTVWAWQEPFTAVYTTYEQHRLAGALDHEFARYHGRPSAAVALQREQSAVAAAARRFRAGAHPGRPIGRIRVPRMGLDMVVVDGTSESALEKGPGRYFGSAMPGQDRLVYIAGHRTTYLAPFSKIDQLRKGDRITLEMPYATFVYRVTGYRIVPAGDLRVLRSPDHELLELQACHPRFSASHRYIAYALPVLVKPRGLKPYRPRSGLVQAAAHTRAGS